MTGSRRPVVCRSSSQFCFLVFTSYSDRLSPVVTEMYVQSSVLAARGLPFMSWEPLQKESTSLPGCSSKRLRLILMEPARATCSLLDWTD